MRSFDKRRGVLGKWAIVIMMALVLAFLASVAPVNGAAKTKYCSDTCSKSIKSDDPDYGYHTWDEDKKTKICKTSKGTKYLYQHRECATGGIIKECHKRSYCDNTKKCAEIGDPIVKQIGTWKSCTKWEKTYGTEP